MLSALLRWAHSIRRLHVSRVNTNLTCIVADKDRAQFAPLIAVSATGESTLGARFLRAIDDAKAAHERTRAANRAGP